MYAFDLLSSSGGCRRWSAAAGLVHLARADRRRAALLAADLRDDLTFALGYNVGDAHVFFLPSHLVVALLAAAGARRLAACHRTATAACCRCAFARGRCVEHRGQLSGARPERGSSPTAVLTATDGGLRRSTRRAHDRPELAAAERPARTSVKDVRPEVLHARLPTCCCMRRRLIRDNLAVGREIVTTERAARQLVSGLWPALRIDRTRRRADARGLSVGRLPAGRATCCACSKPTREFVIDYGDARPRAHDVSRAGQRSGVPAGDYVVAGGPGRRAARLRPRLESARSARASRIDGSAGRRSDGVVAGLRHHSTDGLWARHCQSAPRAHRRARRQLRGARCGRAGRRGRRTRPASSRPSRATCAIV